MQCSPGRISGVLLLSGSHRGDQHLIDPVAVHIEDLELEIIPGKPISGLGCPLEVHHHKPPERLVIPALLAGQAAYVEEVVKLVDWEHPVEEP